MRPGDPNLDMLELMAAKLGDLAEQLVFVGGSTTGLFITDPLLPPVRVTRDVDVITEASSRQRLPPHRRNLAHPRIFTGHAPRGTHLPLANR